MKLLMENWRRFIKEQELQEATDEEISHLDDALEIPVDKLPFGNIFGDRYRIIEELKIIDPDSPLKITMDALMKMGWEVSEPSGIAYDEKNRISGKIWCTKTKITKYIDKSGEIQTVKRAVKLNLPKLLTGIVKFVEQSRPVLRQMWIDTIAKALHRKILEKEKNGEDYRSPEDKYRIGGHIHKNMGAEFVNKSEYMSIMKYVSGMHYWLGMSPDTLGFSSHIEYYFEREKIDIDKMKDFSLFLDQKFQNFLENIGDLYENYYLIYSRHPVDVFRMSDHRGLDSCHSLPSGKHGKWDQYNICALSEAYGNGMIVYAVSEFEFKNKGVEPTNEGLEEMDDQEIFADEMRGNDGLEPSSRLRIRNTSYHGGDEPIRLAVAEKRVYGIELPGLRDKINTRVSTSQKAEIDKIAESSEIIDLGDFTRYGGDYQDNEVSSLIPQLFSKVGKSNTFTGDVNYDWDLQNSLNQKVGHSTVAQLNSRLDDIFAGHTGGMFSFSHNVHEDHDGSAIYDWNMFIRFYVDFKSDKDVVSYETYNLVKSIVSNAVQHQFSHYYSLPESGVDSDIVWNAREGKFLVIIDYHSSALVEYPNIEDLDEEIRHLLHEDPKFYDLFDRYHDDGPIQYIESEFKRHGLIESDEYKVESIIEKHELEDKSWWSLEEREHEDHTFGELTVGVSFQEESGFYPDELIEGIPDNLKPVAIRVMAEYVNMLHGNWKFSTEVVHGVEYNDNLPPITITAEGYLDGDGKLTVEDMANIVEEESELNLIFATSLTKSMSKQKLDNIGNFLVNDASIDEIIEKIQDNIKAKIASAMEGLMLESRRKIKVKIIR